MEGQKNLRALLPIGVFLLLYLGFGIIFEYVLKTQQGFYGVQAIVVFLIALLVAADKLQDKRHTFNEKISIMAKGVADDNIVMMRVWCFWWPVHFPEPFLRQAARRVQ